MRGVPRERLAISSAPSESRSTPRIVAARRRIAASSRGLVVVEAGDEPEPVAQRAGDEPGAGGGADEREAGQVEPDRLRARTLADDDVEAEVLHRGIQALLDDTREAVHLVDEQHVAVVEVREDGGEVARPLERGPARRRDARAHLGRDDAGQARLAEAGRTREQHVVDGLAPPLGGGEHDVEVLAQAGLADELVEATRPQRGLLGDLLGIGLRAEQLVSHGDTRGPGRARSLRASRSRSSTVPSAPICPSASRTSSAP